MEFRDLKRQYTILKTAIDDAVRSTLAGGNYINGSEVHELEKELAEYVGTKHCITCANGTDALQLALMSWNIGEGDAVFVPDFTFFATAEVVALLGAVPVLVDIETDTFNMSAESLEEAIQIILSEGKLTPKVVIPVDLFGQPYDHEKISQVAIKYGLKVLEDGAQGFGGRIGSRHACSLGDIATTSFFPAKPLGCYGDGGALFTDDDFVAELLRSLRVHGKGSDKYDNVRIGLNSRLDTIQAAILKVKFETFKNDELNKSDTLAREYSKRLRDYVIVPEIPEGFFSSWAQYTILLGNEKQRDTMREYLKEHKIPSMIYYPKGLHEQEALRKYVIPDISMKNAEYVSKRCLSLPMHPYLQQDEIEYVCKQIQAFLIGGSD